MSKQRMLTTTAMAALCALALFSLQAKAQAREEGKGMVVVRDAQTGKMRAPTPDELRALRAKTPPPPAAMAGSAQPQTLTNRRSGARGVRLGEKTLVYEVVTRGADGKLSETCVQGADAAEHALHGPTNDASNAAPHAEHKEHAHEAR